MNVAVLLAKDTANPEGLPSDWPVLCRELGDSTELPKDGRPWKLWTVEQLEDEKDKLKDEKDAWNQAHETQD